MNYLVILIEKQNKTKVKFYSLSQLLITVYKRNVNFEYIVLFFYFIVEPPYRDINYFVYYIYIPFKGLIDTMIFKTCFYIPEKTESSYMRGRQFVSSCMKCRYSFPPALGAKFLLVVRFPCIHCDGENEC